MKDEIEVRKPREDELSELVPIYRKVFKKHNIFQGEDNEIKEYLQRKYREEPELGFLVALKNNKIVGGLLLRKVGGDEKHWNIRLNHFAIDEAFRGQGIGTALIDSVDELILDLKGKGKLESAKIETRVSENEKRAIEFFKKFGYETEGESKSHYRKGESAYFLGKEID
ncbi:GNAT family N-acetyltransferase [Candidatus Woesearchaeota archaeon]|nr:MAG: GNAT family N-acetyltransferase [Candidatus Woesearchaeota archaeon]